MKRRLPAVVALAWIRKSIVVASRSFAPSSDPFEHRGIATKSDGSATEPQPARSTLQRGSVTATAVLCVLAGLAALTFASRAPETAHASPASANGCAALEKGIRTAFPKAKTVGFRYRTPAEEAERRHPYWPGWCSNWYVRYTGFAGRSRDDGTDVMVSVYRSRRYALSAFDAEPGSQARGQILPSGARIIGAAAVGSASVASLFRNVIVISGDVGQYGPPDTASAKASLRAQTRIHRWVHAAVLRLGRAAR